MDWKAESSPDSKTWFLVESGTQRVVSNPWSHRPLLIWFLPHQTQAGHLTLFPFHAKERGFA